MRSFEGTEYGSIDARRIGPNRAQGRGDDVRWAAISKNAGPRE
jgi:hypothetical protein